MSETTLILLERKEQWRMVQNTLIELGNQIAVNDKNRIDIQTRIYEWSDEAKARSRECEAIRKILE